MIKNKNNLLLENNINKNYFKKTHYAQDKKRLNTIVYTTLEVVKKIKQYN